MAYAPRHFGQLQFFSSNMTFVFITYTFLYLISNSVYNICQISLKCYLNVIFTQLYALSSIIYSCLSFCSLGSFQLSPGHFWSHSEPEKPSSLTSQNTPGATLERMLKHWNTTGLAASEIAIRYTIRNAESLSTRNYDMTYCTCKILFCIMFYSCFLHVFCDNIQYF